MLQTIWGFVVDKWEVIFSGFGVTLAMLFIGWIFKTKPASGEQNNIYTNKVTVEPVQKEDRKDLAFYKDTTRILFIDDDKDFKVVKILKNAGWLHTSLIKDVKDLDQKEVVESDILFVDIQGVGVALGFADEGLGVAEAIKKRNPQKKVVIYSAQAQGERLHSALSMADSLLKKNADPYEFIQLVEGFTIGN